MNQELSNFAVRLLPLLRDTARQARNNEFNDLALELFALQLKHNPAYRKICEGRKLMPGAVEHWTEIPVVPTAVFKEMELSSIPPAERTAVFHSSGTTEQKPSRHFHSAESLKVYEASLMSWFVRYVVPDSRFTIHDSRVVCLTPPPAKAPHSSLVYMFEIIRQKLGSPETAFVGKLAADGSWTLNFDALPGMLNSTLATRHSSLVLGTAFSFVHLLDHLAENNLRFQLPAGSRVMETGGYKNRSRTIPKSELCALITERLGVPPENIICEYGMSELSSQAYGGVSGNGNAPRHASLDMRHFRFPPWARVQIVSPETGREVAEGGTGLIRIFDLANVFSVMAIQTEDLGVRHGEQFELIGRAAMAEARGCSLMTV